MLQATSPLHKLHCKDTGSAQVLSKQQRDIYLSKYSQWFFSAEKQNIFRHFKFKDYDATLAFVNAVAEIAKIENHHPNIAFSYNTCSIQYSTHSANGVTLYDFICAAHIDQL